MTNRRDLLKAGFAASTLPLTGSAAALAATVVEPREPVVGLYKVLYDVRFPASVEFAGRAAANGRIAVAISGDMTRFWYDDLYHRWCAGPAAIAGLTAHGALFCLEQLAWTERMRVVFRVEHARAAGSGVAHAIEGPASLLPAAVEAAQVADWPRAMADVIARCPQDSAVRHTARVTTAMPGVTAPDEPLFSWIIAPAGRSAATSP